MKTLRLFRLELGRLFHSRPALLVFGLTALSPVVWLLLYGLLGSAMSDSITSTMNDLYIAYPAITGGIVGAVLFAVLTIWQLDAPHKFQVTTITNAMVSPLTQALVRLLALLSAAVVTQAAALLLWLPYTVYRVGEVFDGGVYLLSYLVLMLPSWLLAVLFSAAAYQFTRRADLSLVAFLIFAALSLIVWADNWQLCWLNPILFALSDDFSNVRLFRTIGYARLTWLLGLAGLYAVSYLCVRQYGKGIFGSLGRSVRRVYRPAIAALLLAAAGLAYVGQPFYDQSSPDLSQYILDVDYDENLTLSQQYAEVVPDPKTGCLHGRAVYQLQNADGQEKTLEMILDPGYALSSVLVNGQEAEYRDTGIQMDNGRVVKIPLPAASEIELELTYGGFPKEWNITTMDPGEPEISSTYMRLENWRLYPWTRNAVPFDVSTTMDVTLPQQMTPVLFGSEQETLLQENGDGTKTWRLQYNKRGAIFYAGDYVRKDIQAADLTVSLYYGRKHEAIMEQAHVEDAVRAVIEYCTEHYGPLSFYENGTIKLLMTRVSGGGYAGDGASTMDEGDFTAENLLNASKGASAGSGAVMIHELVHQWWGLGNMFDDFDPASSWSAEGLTVYTTYRIMKELYGGEYAKAHYVDQWQQEVEDYYQNFYIRNPEYLSALPETYQYNISNSLAAVLRYSVMPLKILKAEQLVGGEEAMDQILHDLFNRELDWTYPYLTYPEFLDYCGLIEEDLSLA